jgi:hypothetical protein
MATFEKKIPKKLIVQFLCEFFGCCGAEIHQKKRKNTETDATTIFFLLNCPLPLTWSTILFSKSKVDTFSILQSNTFQNLPLGIEKYLDSHHF